MAAYSTWRGLLPQNKVHVSLISHKLCKEGYNNLPKEGGLKLSKEGELKLSKEGEISCLRRVE